MKAKMFIIMIALLVVTTFSTVFVVNAYNAPKRALIYGALVNTTTSTSRAAVVYQVNSTDFNLKPTADMNAVNQISLFFVVPTTVTTFSLSVSCLDSRLTQISDGSFNTSTAFYNWEGTTASDVSYITNVIRNKSTVDGYGTYTWEYYANSSSNRNCIMVNLPLSITVVDDAYYYGFRINYLNVNGQAVEEIETNQQTTSQIEEFNNLLEQTQVYETDLWSKIYVPGQETSLIISASQSALNSGYPIITLMQSNTVVPFMLTCVFALAFFSFLLFGKRGA